MSIDAHRKAVAKFQSKKDRVNIWMSPKGKKELTEYVKTNSGLSLQKFLLKLIKEKTGIDCDPKD